VVARGGSRCASERAHYLRRRTLQLQHEAPRRFRRADRLLQADHVEAAEHAPVRADRHGQRADLALVRPVSVIRAEAVGARLPHEVAHERIVGGEVLLLAPLDLTGRNDALDVVDRIDGFFAGGARTDAAAQAGVSTLSGSTMSGSAIGAAMGRVVIPAARVAVKANGNVCLADTGKNETHKITPGVVTTLAGSCRAAVRPGVAASHVTHGVPIRAREGVGIQWRDGRSPKRGTSDFGSLSVWSGWRCEEAFRSRRRLSIVVRRSLVSTRRSLDLNMECLPVTNLCELRLQGEGTGAQHPQCKAPAFAQLTRSAPREASGPMRRTGLETSRVNSRIPSGTILPGSLPWVVAWFSWLFSPHYAAELQASVLCSLRVARRPLRTPRQRRAASALWASRPADPRSWSRGERRPAPVRRCPQSLAKS
jgi:hypothetical protein